MESTILGLRNILEHSLTTNNTILFDNFRIHEDFRKFEAPEELQIVEKASKDIFLSIVPRPTLINKLIPGWKRRYKNAIQAAEKDYQDYETKYEKRFDAIVKYRDIELETYAQEKKTFDTKKEQRNKEVDEFEKNYRENSPEAIISYFTIILEQSVYPESFPQEFRIAYLSAPKELVIEYELPTKDIVPDISEYRYVKTRNEISEKLRKITEKKDIYQDVVSAICLRTIYEVFKADQENHVDVVAFNGFVQSVDPATGLDIRTTLNLNKNHKRSI